MRSGFARAAVQFVTRTATAVREFIEEHSEAGKFIGNLFANVIGVVGKLVEKVFSVLGSLQFFDLIWIMTTGGPVGASDTMATYLYKFGFQRFQLGYGSAIAVLMFLICFGFSVVYQSVAMRRDFE